MDGRGVEDRRVGLGLECLGQVQERGQREGHVGHHPDQACAGVAVRLIDVDEVDQAGVGETSHDLKTFGLVDAAVDKLVAGDPHADDESVADTLADRGHHLEAEAHPVLKAAAIPIGALIGDRRQKAVDQMMGGGDDLDAIKAALLAARRRVTECLDDAAEIPVLHLLGIGAMQLLAVVRGADQRQAVPPLGRVATAEMGELTEDGSTVLMHPRREGVEIGQDAVVAAIDLAER